MTVSLASVSVLLAVGFTCSSPAPRHTYAFGRVGGNIAPYTVDVHLDGTLSSSGPVRLANPSKSVPAATLRRLGLLVRSTGFSSLPARTTCAGALPDFAASFVTVKTGSTSKRVLVRGDCRPGFQRLYRALAAAAGVG